MANGLEFCSRDAGDASQLAGPMEGRANLEWQPHPVQKGRIAPVASDAVQQRVDFHIGKAGVASRVSLIQPYKGIFGFTAVRVRAGDLISTVVAILHDEFS